ncbi:MAG: hypothetical protein M1829_003639 [Trizodia sp. TS-e1964]|nr:MAG: hypothetical protein M1829_003639 [Trizodia sp. TS-e1964]
MLDTEHLSAYPPPFEPWKQELADHNRPLPAMSLRATAPLEQLLSQHPPILESLIAQLPTAAFLNLYHSSKFLRSFFQSYPTVWSYLSFRLLQPSASNGGSPAPAANGRTGQPRPYALDQLLMTIVLPFGTRLTSLDLDNTAVAGHSLTCYVLPQRKESLEHLSIRGCKNISLKYHIVPFLQLQLYMAYPASQGKPNSKTHPILKDFALKSLYTYRSRHHRRRPYFPSSLARRDSDSEPTHELIEVCHKLGIWTDTAWCPTPGGRCVRRKDYFSGRGGQGSGEVWVVFDRLWRSGNRIGPSELRHEWMPQEPDGRLWEENESGQDGEALGCPEGNSSKGEGKHMPTHLRKSHRTFVEDVKCSSCGDAISERCEQCSVRMHCLGCRETYCASCAFDRPLSSKCKSSKKKGTKAATQAGASNLSAGPVAVVAPTTLGSVSNNNLPNATARPPQPVKDRFWWAPGAHRSPNQMQEDDPESDSDEEETPSTSSSAASSTLPATLPPPQFNQNWCCVEPIFSGGGGFIFNSSTQEAEKLRTCPLPRGQGYEDEDFCPKPLVWAELGSDLRAQFSRDPRPGYINLLPYLKQKRIGRTSISPRTLCPLCYNSENWKVECNNCLIALCKEHDLKSLRFRVCGFRDFKDEKREFDHPRPAQWEINPGFLEEFKDMDPAVLSPIYLRLATLTVLPGSETADSITLADTGENTPNDLVKGEFAPFPPENNLPVLPELIYNVNDEVLIEGSLYWGFLHKVAERTPKPQWYGCGRYFCQEGDRRDGSDQRPKCNAKVMVCVTCGVHECEVCEKAKPHCACSYCEKNFNCPNCYLITLSEGLCRRKAEEAIRKARAKKLDDEKFAALMARMHTDVIAEQVGEFLEGLESISATDTVATKADTSSTITAPLAATATEGATTTISAGASTVSLTSNNGPPADATDLSLATKPMVPPTTVASHPLAYLVPPPLIPLQIDPTVLADYENQLSIITSHHANTYQPNT